MKKIIQSYPKRWKYCFFIFLFVFILISNNSSCAFCKEKTPQGDGIRTLYLIRHGDYNYRDKHDPDIGKGLIPLGIAQARLVASRLRSLPVKMTSLYSSTMTRARQTAMVINEEFPNLKLQQTRLLRECVPPTWRKDIMAKEDPKEVMECKNRLDKAFAQFFKPSPEMDRHDIIVCHGNVIRYFVTKVLGVDSMSWLGMTINNCSLTVVRIYPNGSMKLVSFNDIGHIPPNMRTETGPIKKERYLRVHEK